VSSARALLLALALESSSGDNTRPLRFRKRKTAYFATLTVRPEEYDLFGMFESSDGIELLWRYTGRPRLSPC
jgi:hypothetical protein